jgi:hypothetical protein
MHSLIGAAIALLVLSTGGALADGRAWDASPYPGEPGKPAIGCSLATNDDFWTCLAVRCENDGALGLYFINSDGGVDGSFSIAIDGEVFSVRQEPAGDGAAFPTRLVGDVASIVARLKSGSQVRLLDTSPPLNAGFDTIPLRGSSRAIGAVEAACAPAASTPVAAAVLLRDGSGKVSIGNLSRATDCAFAETTGVVEKVRRGGPGGGIDGVTFLDDRFGSGFINVEPLAAGPDLQVRRATLDHLLTAGRRLSIGVHGCGAGGRVEELVSATERP